MNGYWNKILRVDLSQGTVKDDAVDEVVCKKFIGGAGLGSKLLYDEVNPGIRALSPENEIVFSTGPFQSTKLPGSAKWCVVSKSPLTGTYADSHCGANWGVEFKSTGYDALIVQGKADKPVYIWVHDDEAEIRDATDFWGLDTYETVDALKKDVNEPRASVATIGPAGERLVRIACIAVDKHSFAGRCGIGAVMGSKNLKAVVVHGTKKPPLFDSDKVNALSRELAGRISKFAEEFRKHGTPSGLLSVSYTHLTLPTICSV